MPGKGLEQDDECGSCHLKGGLGLAQPRDRKVSGHELPQGGDQKLPQEDTRHQKEREITQLREDEIDHGHKDLVGNGVKEGAETGHPVTPGQAAVKIIRKPEEGTHAKGRDLGLRPTIEKETRHRKQENAQEREAVGRDLHLFNRFELFPFLLAFAAASRPGHDLETPQAQPLSTIHTTTILP